MKTTKPISTISFNSKEFLEQKLTELHKAKIIEFWAFIHHLGEDDEKGTDAVHGKKDHNHVWLMPANNLQTEDLRDEFREPDPEHPDKPLGVLPFHKSPNFGDWIMYSLHDRAYLMEKNESKQYHYKYTDIVTSDDDELYRLYCSVDMSRLMPYNALIRALEEGRTFSEYVNESRLPIKQIAYFQKAWDMVAYEFEKKYAPKQKWKITEEDRKTSKENLRELKKKKGVLKNEWIEQEEGENSPFDEVE